jgi:hypothetical protein
MKREHSVHKIGLIGERQAVFVLVVEIDVVARDDRRHAREVDAGVGNARIQERVKRHQNSEPGRPWRTGDQFAHALEHVAGNPAFKRSHFGIDIVLAQVRSDLCIDARSIERLPPRQRRASRKQSIQKPIQGVAQGSVD